MEHNVNEELIIVKIFNNSFEANLAKDKLNAKGIASFQEEENVVGLNPLGGIELKVLSKDLKSATAILAE